MKAVWYERCGPATDVLTHGERASTRPMSAAARAIIAAWNFR
jgi:hypothetical protein